MRFFRDESFRLATPRVNSRGVVGRSLILLGAVLALAGCETVPATPIVAHTGDPITDGNAERNVAKPQDRVLWDYRIAASALRAGNYDEAREKLDDAILRIGGIIANSDDAKKARGLFGSESGKTFIGEPYERVMAYYYRGLLYWRDGQPDNARACYRSGQLIDSDADDATHKADYVLLDYLDGLATAKLSGDGSASFDRAQGAAQGRKLPPYEADANVLVFAEFGHGPMKYGAGEYAEQLRFRVIDSRAHSAVLTIDGNATPLPPYDDVSFQAITRGGRVMDHILGNKAVFKSTSDTVGNAALAGSAIAANNLRRGDGSYSRGAENTALALGAIGLISKVASAATTPRADTRQWNNLPQRLSFAALKLPAGEHTGSLEFLDADGTPIAAQTRQVTINVEDPSRDTVVFLSELKR
ncbi:MAG: Tetratricopeptide 2 repeat protein [Verrucomicrobia bacterium]|nr:Tetratricopeptide 2 repeat protein [Verrucomicrobiota bacterium]